MKWISHKLLTGLMVYSLTNDAVGATISAFGALLPDKIENQDYNNFDLKRHRKLSHWFIPYTFLALVLYLVIYFKAKEIPDLFEIMKYFFKDFKLTWNFISTNYVILITTAFFYFLVGCIFHLLEDSISGRIPLLNPKKKVFGVKLIETNSTLEYIFTTIVTIVFFIFIGRKIFT